MALNRELLTQIEAALERALLNTFSSAQRLGRSARTDSIKDRLDDQRERAKQTSQSQKDSRMAKNITEAQKNLLESYKKATVIIEGESKNSRERQRAHEDYVDALDESMAALKNYTSKYRDLLGKSLYNQLGEFKEMQKNTHGLTSALAASQRNTSLLAAALIESFNEVEIGTDKYRAYMRQLTSSVSTLDRSFLQQSNFIDEQTGKIRDNLSPEDFAELRKSLGEAQTAISENLGQLGIKSLTEFMKSGEGAKLLALPSTDDMGDNPALRFQQSLLVLAKQLEKMGYDFGKQLEAPESIDWEKLALKISSISDATDNFATNMNKAARNANTLYGNFAGLSSIAMVLRTKFIKPLIETGTILMAVSKSKDAAIDLFSQMTNFNIASIPASFVDVQLASAKLGMSFDETVTFLQENKRALALYGTDGGREVLNRLTPMFESFGYSLKQASEMIAPAIQAGISAGIDIKSGEKLNKFIEESMHSFKNISSIVNISAKEYMALNAELLGSADVQGTLLGMDRSRAEVYGKQLIALRDNYVQLGMSTEQAQELVKTQESLKKESVTTRVKEGAKGMVLAKQLGLGDEAAQRYFQLAMKGRLSEQERVELTEISRQMGLAREQRMQEAADTGIGASMIQQTMTEILSPTGVLGDIIGATQPLTTAQRANIQVTDAAAEMAKALGTGSSQLAGFQNMLETVVSVMKNSFVVAAAGAAFSLTAVAVQAYAASKALGLISGKGVLGGLSDMIFGKSGGAEPGAPKTGGGALGKLLSIGRVVGGGAATVAGTALLGGVDVAGKVEQASGSSTLGTLTSILSNLAVGAGGGFMTGGLPGALIGSLFGLGSGVYSNWDRIISGGSKPPEIKREQIPQQQPIATKEDINRKTNASGIVNVVDSSANEKLQIIADNIVKIVGIMQTAVEEKKQSTAYTPAAGRSPSFSLGDMNSIPSGLSYVTAA
jgi:hypothetical protein